MVTIDQKHALDDELRTSMRLIKVGLRELNRLDGANDFYHLPILLLSTGIERLMKATLCCYHLTTEGEFPKKPNWAKNPKGHNLVYLLNEIIEKCYSDSYLSQIPATGLDIDFLRDDPKLKAIVKFLSDFGMSARYYNLNVILEISNTLPKPESVWQNLVKEIVNEKAVWKTQISDPRKYESTLKEVNRILTIQCEKFVRAISRLFTIGGFDQQAKSLTGNMAHFLSLMDKDLGTKDYESLNI